jgi:predicted nucleic acid-binding protein
MVKYFLDTYAMWEIINGNKSYADYLNEEICTSIFNLYELYYNLIKETSEDKAKEKFFFFKRFLIHFTDKEIFEASLFKLKYKKEDISYTDALGYAIALENGMKFLTGDIAFKNKENVEYVK